MATNVKRKKKAEVMPDDGNMTLTGHLKELRNRLIVCAVVFVAAVVVTLAYADRLIDLLTAMGQGFYTFVSIAPQEKLMQYFRVSLLAAVVVTVPVALYQMYAFAKPGLKKSETFFLKLVILLGLALFVVGVMFAYKLMMPFMLRFLSTGIEGADYIQTTTSIESYVSLCLTMFIIFGCVFEMPLVTIILSKMGIANPEILKKARGVAIVLIFFIAAVVTPPDIVSQCMVAIPMVLLYFVSIFLSGIFYKPRSESEDEEDEEENQVQLSEENKQILDEMGKDQKKKGKKEKKPKKEKAAKEKKPKKEKKRKEKKEKIPEVPEKKLSLKKVIPIVVVCISLGAVILLLSSFLTEYMTRRSGRKAYYAGDYQTCYQNFFGKELDETEQVMYSKSESILTIRMWLREYEVFVNEGSELEALDSLLQAVHDYPSLLNYATEYNAQDEVTVAFQEILNVLSQKYGLSQEEAQEIADISNNVEYTQRVMTVLQKLGLESWDMPQIVEDATPSNDGEEAAELPDPLPEEKEIQR